MWLSVNASHYVLNYRVFVLMLHNSSAVSANVPPLEIHLLNGSPTFYEDSVEAEFITTRPVTRVRCFLRCYINSLYKDCMFFSTLHIVLQM